MDSLSVEPGQWTVDSTIPGVQQTVDKYLACGDYRCGVARVFCENCATDYFVPFSCKGRGLCPSCTQRRVLTRAEDLIEETFQPVPHRHLVVSLPKALRKAFLYNRDLLRQEVPQLEGTLERMQTWEHSGFDLYLGKVLEAYNKPATQNLTEYILRPSFSLGAIEVDEQEGQFVYRAKGAKKSCDPLGPLELLARISTHIPDQYKHPIFRYGLYSNAAAGRARREEGGPAGPLGSGARAYPRGRSRARRATAHSPELGRTARPRLGR